MPQVVSQLTCMYLVQIYDILTDRGDVDVCVLCMYHNESIENCIIHCSPKLFLQTHRDRVRNVNIWKNLKMFSLNGKTESSQPCWFGHICRMNEERYPRRAWEGKPKGRRGRGWPRKKCEDNIKESVEGKGAAWARCV